MTNPISSWPCAGPCPRLQLRHTCRCSYERASIEKWFAAGKTTSPKSGAQLAGQPLLDAAVLFCVSHCVCRINTDSKSRFASANSGLAGWQRSKGGSGRRAVACSEQFFKKKVFPMNESSEWRSPRSQAGDVEKPGFMMRIIQIELTAALDNKAESKQLPLSPWA